MIEVTPRSIEEWKEVVEKELTDEEAKQWIKIFEKTGAITDRHMYGYEDRERKFLHDLFQVLRIETIMETAPPSVKERYGIVIPEPVKIERVPRPMGKIVPEVEEILAYDLPSKVISKEELPPIAFKRKDMGLECKAFMCPFNFITEDILKIIENFMEEYYTRMGRRARWIYESEIGYAPYSYIFMNLGYIVYGYCLVDEGAEYVCPWLLILTKQEPRTYKAGKMTASKYQIRWLME